MQPGASLSTMRDRALFLHERGRLKPSDLLALSMAFPQMFEGQDPGAKTLRALRKMVQDGTMEGSSGGAAGEAVLAGRSDGSGSDGGLDHGGWGQARAGVAAGSQDGSEDRASLTSSAPGKAKRRKPKDSLVSKDSVASEDDDEDEESLGVDGHMGRRAGRLPLSAPAMQLAVSSASQLQQSLSLRLASTRRAHGQDSTGSGSSSGGGELPASIHGLASAGMSGRHAHGSADRSPGVRASSSSATAAAAAARSRRGHGAVAPGGGSGAAGRAGGGSGAAAVLAGHSEEGDFDGLDLRLGTGGGRRALGSEMSDDPVSSADLDDRGPGGPDGSLGPGRAGMHDPFALEATALGGPDLEDGDLSMGASLMGGDGLLVAKSSGSGPAGGLGSPGRLHRLHRMEDDESVSAGSGGGGLAASGMLRDGMGGWGRHGSAATGEEPDDPLASDLGDGASLSLDDGNDRDRGMPHMAAEHAMAGSVGGISSLGLGLGMPGHAAMLARSRAAEMAFNLGEDVAAVGAASTEIVTAAASSSWHGEDDQ